jgi:hypothetical protein
LFGEDLCDQELTSLHLSFTVKNEKRKRKRYISLTKALDDFH